MYRDNVIPLLVTGAGTKTDLAKIAEEVASQYTTETLYVLTATSLLYLRSTIIYRTKDNGF